MLEFRLYVLSRQALCFDAFALASIHILRTILPSRAYTIMGKAQGRFFNFLTLY